MRFAFIRWFFCASLFLFVAELDSQTTAPQDGSVTDMHHGSWKVLYEENFEDPASVVQDGNSPAWVR